MQATDLTPLEQAALLALDDAAQDATGGEFGFADEVDIQGTPIKNEKALAGLFGSLSSKNLIWSEEPIVNGRALGTSQFELTDEAKAIVSTLR